MEFSLQIFVNGVCKSDITIPVGKDSINIGLNLVVKEDEDPPKDVPIYTKAQEVAPFMLYAKDIQHKYKLSWTVAKEEVADVLWPDSPQKPLYYNLATDMRDELRRKRWIIKRPVDVLSAETCEAVERLLREL